MSIRRFSVLALCAILIAFAWSFIGVDSTYEVGIQLLANLSAALGGIIAVWVRRRRGKPTTWLYVFLCALGMSIVLPLLVGLTLIFTTVEASYAGHLGELLGGAVVDSAILAAIVALVFRLGAGTPMPAAAS